jgi:hypothetical protein
LNTFFWILWSLYDYTYYLKLFFYNVIFSLVFILFVWIIWKMFWWKAKYLDVLLITTLSEVVFIIMSIISLIFSLIGNYWIIVLILGFIPIPVIIWFLIIWSKWLSKIEQFSETKVTFTVILSVLILYFWNSFLSQITWISVF